MDRLDLSRDVRARLSELSRRNGETEDRLLRRLLGLARKDPGGGSATPINAGSGFEDTTYAILFPEEADFSSSDRRAFWSRHGKLLQEIKEREERYGKEEALAFE